MSKFKGFLISIQIGLESGDLGGLLDYIEIFSFREDNCLEIEAFLEGFDQITEWRDKILYLRAEVSRLLA